MVFMMFIRFNPQYIAYLLSILKSIGIIVLQRQIRIIFRYIDFQILSHHFPDKLVAIRHQLDSIVFDSINFFNS